jgi:hypothetical protein
MISVLYVYSLQVVARANEKEKRERIKHKKKRGKRLG